MKKKSYLCTFKEYIKMKRFILTVLFLAALASTSQAQLMNWGLRAGVGPALYVDNMSTSGVVPAANVGAFLSFGFTEGQSFFAENFWLQTGLNFIHRGTRFQEIYERDMFISIRKGYYSAYYIQLPVLATFRYELPVRNPGHRLLLSIGPGVSYGLFGVYNDRWISPGYPQTALNYNNTTDAFSDLNRLDVNLLFGLGYEYKDLSFMLQLDYGFMAVNSSNDVLKQSEASIMQSIQSMAQESGLSVPSVFSTANANAKVPGGNNLAVMLSVGYQFPVH